MGRKSLLRGTLAAISVCILTGFSMTAAADGSIWDSTTSRDEANNICIDFQEVQVLLPDSWSGKCQMSIYNDSVSFYQIKSRELWTQELGYDNGGWLFSLSCAQHESEYQDNPNYLTLGTGSEGIYYATFPTDFQAYVNDAEAVSEYQDMSVDMEWVKTHITVTPSGSQVVIGNEEYILPNSSTEYLTENDLVGLDADQVQMAINEIYARHHRKFVLQDVQEYFNSKSWYEGTVEPEDFDINVMNKYEGANIDLMAKRLKALNAATESSK